MDFSAFEMDKDIPNEESSTSDAPMPSSPDAVIFSLFPEGGNSTRHVSIFVNRRLIVETFENERE
jgi:hypothetical protein